MHLSILAYVLKKNNSVDATVCTSYACICVYGVFYVFVLCYSIKMSSIHVKKKSSCTFVFSLLRTRTHAPITMALPNFNQDNTINSHKLFSYSIHLIRLRIRTEQKKNTLVFALFLRRIMRRRQRRRRSVQVQ